MTQSGPGTPAFQSTSVTEADEGKQPPSLEITQDENGKALSYAASQGAVATNPVAWSDSDPLTLSENSLHYVEAHAAQADFAPFSQGLTTLNIEAGILQGSNVAKVEILSNASTKKLDIYLSLAGVVISYEVVP